MKKTKFITKAKRLLSGFVATAIAASMLPTLPAMAEETTEKYPYTLFAGSSEESAITVNAGNFCVNGNVATNGTIMSSGNMNINGTKTIVLKSRYIVYDFYDWEKDSEKAFIPTVSDGEMYTLHESGYAKQFYVYGEYINETA